MVVASLEGQERPKIVKKIFLPVAMLLTVLLANGLFYNWFRTIEADVNGLNADWSQQAQVSMKKATYLSEVERSLGYLGFIHHFKNFVLRRTPKYRELTENALTKAMFNLNSFQSLPLSLEEREQVAMIWDTLVDYQHRFEQAQKEDWQAMSAEALDALVAVDDSQAAAAFESLRANLLPEFLDDVSRHQQQIAKLWEGEMAGTSVILLMVITNFLYGLACIFIYVRAVRPHEDNVRTHRATDS